MPRRDFVKGHLGIYVMAPGKLDVFEARKINKNVKSSDGFDLSLTTKVPG